MLPIAYLWPFPAMTVSDPIILGIESSCDETAAAVMVGRRLASNVVATQAVHEAYGGVVPELASRAHQAHIVPVVHRALTEAGVGRRDLHAVAFTRGPGLLGALLVGASFAKGLALALGVPLIGVHHMRAHILSHFIEAPSPPFPFLCLTVSGGHTQLVRVDGPLDSTVLGQTLDDAVGEAFDKTAKLLGLPYPGGPFVDRYAAAGDPRAFDFTVGPMPGLDFSFSGIKTKILYFLRDAERAAPDFALRHRADLCASVQRALVEMLLAKVRQAVAETGLRHVAIAGGVSANRGLRAALTAEAAARDWTVYIPPLAYCTDNAAMIAMAGHFHYQAGDFVSQAVSPLARWPL